MKQIKIPQRKFLKLYNLLNWYEIKPKHLDLGDRFHEDVDEAVFELLPDFPEVEADTHYAEMPRTCGTSVRVVLSPNGGNDPSVKIELVPK